jgi:hypothetical protein
MHANSISRAIKKIGMPAGVSVGESVVQAVAQHAVVERLRERVATHFLGLAGPAADQTPRSGNSRPTNRNTM